MAPKKQTKKKMSKKKKRRLKIFKWTSIIVLLLGAIIMFLLSDLFNIKEIKVIDNNKITQEEIISLSKIKTNENMFKFLKLKAIENIKTNPYIEDVKIHRKLNGTIEIIVIERTPTYMLNIEEEQYAYINNQGYVLEINSEKIEKPVILGFTSENLEAGNRLNVADLKKLNIVVKIMNTAEDREIADKISNINIENDQDILITMESEEKIIHFGDEKSINDKFVKLMAVLADTERTKRGNIFKKHK